MAIYEHWRGLNKFGMIIDLLIDQEEKVEGSLEPADYFLSGAHDFTLAGELDISDHTDLPSYMTAGDGS